MEKARYRVALEEDPTGAHEFVHEMDNAVRALDAYLGMIRLLAEGRPVRFYRDGVELTGDQIPQEVLESEKARGVSGKGLERLQRLVEGQPTADEFYEYLRKYGPLEMFSF